MSTDLYKVSGISWAVKSPFAEEISAFTSIESAATYLESLGVPSDEIDIALIEMAGHGHTRAQFGNLEGKFIFSDNARLGELLGIA